MKAIREKLREEQQARKQGEEEEGGHEALLPSPFASPRCAPPVAASPALYYLNNQVLILHDFCTVEEESWLLHQLDDRNSKKWTPLRHRRVQCFGGDPVPDAAARLDLPAWLKEVLAHIQHTLNSSNLLPLPLLPSILAYNHVLANEYKPGDCILPHTDGPLYAPVTVTLSLGQCDADMVFTPRLRSHEIGQEEEAKELLRVRLASRCLVVFWGEAYTNMLHSIDHVEPSTTCSGTSPRRVSLTFRKIL